MIARARPPLSVRLCPCCLSSLAATRHSRARNSFSYCGLPALLRSVSFVLLSSAPNNERFYSPSPLPVSIARQSTRVKRAFLLLLSRLPGRFHLFRIRKHCARPTSCFEGGGDFSTAWLKNHRNSPAGGLRANRTRGGEINPSSVKRWHFFV